MERPTGSKARLTLAIVTALAAALAGMPAFSLAAPLATDEYLLEFPGVQGTDNSPVAPVPEANATQDGIQQGVVGEGSPPQAPLESFISSIGSASPALIAGAGALLLVVAGVAVSLRTRPRVRAAR